MPRSACTLAALALCHVLSCHGMALFSKFRELNAELAAEWNRSLTTHHTLLTTHLAQRTTYQTPLSTRRPLLPHRSPLATHLHRQVPSRQRRSACAPGEQRHPAPFQRVALLPQPARRV